MRRIAVAALAVLAVLALVPAAALAGTATAGPMTVTATVSNNCTISLPAAVSVATDTLTDVSTTGAVSVTCTKGASYTVTLTSANSWTLKNGGNTLNYVIFQPDATGAAATTTQWNAANAWAGTSTTRASAKVLTFTVQIPAQDAIAGTYNDTVNATINF